MVRAIALLFILTVLAGCSQSDQAPEPETPAGTPTGAPDTILHSNGTDMDVDQWIGLTNASVPVGASRYTDLPTFEPTIGVDSDGSIFYGTWDFWNEDLGVLKLLSRSHDDGLTWEDVTPRLPSGHTFPPDSNDPYVHVDPDTDRIFLFNLHYLGCMTLGISDDGGETWTLNPIACGVGGIQDHQTLWTAKPRLVETVDYPNVVHYCVNRVTDAACASSLNGGLTWGPLRPLVYEPVGTPNVDQVVRLCLATTAHGTAAPDGTIYLPRGHCGFPTVAISEDDGLTWEQVVVSTDIPMQQLTCCIDQEITLYTDHEIGFAVDEVGKAYAMWMGGEDELMYLAASNDGGKTWGEPYRITPPDVNRTSFPTLAAGADGRVAAAYYGTANATAGEPTPDDAVWNAYLSIILDADGAPIIATVPVNDLPVARGPCDSSNRCPNDNGVGDFIDVVIDHEGRPWAALADTCRAQRECTQPSSDDRTVGFVGTLAQGPALRGPLGPLPPLQA